MKVSSIFTYILPFLAANIVSGGRLTSALICSSEARSQYVSLSLSGGATKALSPKKGPFATTRVQRKAAFLPMEADISIAQPTTNSLPSNGVSLVAKMRSLFHVSGDDGLTLRQRMAQKGFATFLSFTMLSNMTSISIMSFAWYLFSVKTGMSPLFPGQWKPFLALNAGFMAMDSVMKPFRLALAIAAAPYADKVMGWLKSKFNGSKSISTGVALASVIVSSFGMFAGGIALASSFSGVPVFVH